MPVKLVWVGKKYIVLEWCEDDKSLLNHFLQEINSFSPSKVKKIAALITKIANDDKFSNNTVCKEVSPKKFPGLNVLLPGDGIGIYWFYYFKDIIIASYTKSIYLKSKSESNKAWLIRNNFLKEKNNDPP